MNKKQQGDRGVAAAIAYYTFQECAVFVPLTDNERYDLVVDKDSKLQRVQVKTTNYRRKATRGYEVCLVTTGGNQSFSGIKKKISSDECDLLFVLAGDGRAYEFEADVFHDKSMLYLGVPRDVDVVMQFPANSLS